MKKLLCIKNKKIKQGIQPAESIDLYSYEFVFSTESTLMNCKKIIPYVILKSYDTFIIYEKIKKINSNTHKFISLGFDCEISNMDSNGELKSDDVRISLTNILSNSVNRNLKNLLDLDLRNTNKAQLFWIYSGDDSYDKNKFGIVILADIEDLDISYEKVKSNFNSSIKFVTKKDLVRKDFHFDEWSQYIIDVISKYKDF